MLEIKFAKTNEGASIPRKREEDAGYDIFPYFDEDYLIIDANETIKIPTGIASSFSADYCFILKERGSTGSLGLGQRAGVIDSGYRNEWLIPITNHNLNPLIIIKKEFKNSELYGRLRSERTFIEYSYEKAIAQALLIPVPKTKIREVSYEDLLKDGSERMLEAFGSTNTK